MISTILLACLFTTLSSNYNVTCQPCKLPNVNVPKSCHKSSVNLPLTNLKSVCTTKPNQLDPLKNAPRLCNNLLVSLPAPCENVLVPSVQPCNSVSVQKPNTQLNRISSCQDTLVPVVQTKLVANSQRPCPPTTIKPTSPQISCPRPVPTTCINNIPYLNEVINTNIPVSSSYKTQTFTPLQVVPSLCEPCLSYPLPTIVNPLPCPLDASGIANIFFDGPVCSNLPGIVNLPCNPFFPFNSQEPIAPPCGTLEELLLPDIGNYCGCSSCSYAPYFEQACQNVPLTTPCYSNVQLVQNLPLVPPCVSPCKTNTLSLCDPCIQSIPSYFFSPTCDEVTVTETPYVDTISRNSGSEISLPYIKNCCCNTLMNLNNNQVVNPLPSRETCIQTKPVFGDSSPCTCCQKAITLCNTITDVPPPDKCDSHLYFLIDHSPVVAPAPENCPNPCLLNNQLRNQVLGPNLSLNNLYQKINCRSLPKPQLPLSCRPKTVIKEPVCNEIVGSLPPNKPNLCVNCQRLNPQFPSPSLSKSVCNEQIMRTIEPCNQPNQLNINCCNQLSTNGATLGFWEPPVISCGTTTKLPLPITGNYANSYPCMSESFTSLLYPESPCVAPVVPMVSIPELNLLDIGNSYYGDPFLPAASPVSPYFNAFTSILPPVDLSACGCNDYKKRSRKPIPPPFI